MLYNSDESTARAPDWFGEKSGADISMMSAPDLRAKLF